MPAAGRKKERVFYLDPEKKIIHKPRTTKRAPAPRFIYFGGTTWLTTEPRRQPKAEVNNKAAADPKKTDHLEWLSAAKQKVASWVLSPNSARKMKPKVVRMALRSTISPS